MIGRREPAQTEAANWIRAVAGLTMLLLSAGPAWAAQYTLRLSTWGSPSAPQVSVFVPEFTKRITEASHGAIAVQHFPAGSLVKEQVVPQSVETRVTDISLATVGSFGSIAPPAMAMNTVFFRPPEDHFEQAVGAGSPLFKALDAAFDKRGLRLLAILDNGPQMVVSRTKLVSPADFKGRTVRASDPLSNRIIQALGAAPSTISVSDVYPALEHGTVQAAFGGIQGEIGLREYEVTKYLLDPNGFLGVGVTIYVMNKAALEALPAALRQSVLNAGYQAEAVANAAIIASFKDDLAEMQKHGMEIKTLQAGSPQTQAFLDAMQPLIKTEQAQLPPDLVQQVQRASQ